MSAAYPRPPKRFARSSAKRCCKGCSTKAGSSRSTRTRRRKRRPRERHLGESVKIALLHNLIPGGAPEGDDTFAEYDNAQTIARVANALRGLDVEVEPVIAD